MSIKGSLQVREYETLLVLTLPISTTTRMFLVSTIDMLVAVNVIEIIM